MQVAVLGLGYVGLSTAVCLAELGHSVTGYDIDPQRVRLLMQNEVPFHEPEIDALIAVHQARGQLGFTVDLSLALQGCDVVMLAVGTPQGHNGDAELGAVKNAVHSIGQQLQQPAVVAVKSTVPVGTCERLEAALQDQLRKRGMTGRVPVVSNPEFLREGRAVQDFLDPDRIIVGVTHRADAELMHALYAPLLERGHPLLVMDTRSAELTKYTANVMLAARISLINEVASLAELMGADVEQVAKGVGLDRRIGPHFLHAGIGYGGSCFPKDVKAMIRMASDLGVPSRLLQAVDQVNERQRRCLFEKISHFYGGPEGLRGKRIALWGLAFKPGTDDLREAPSLVLLRQLVGAGAEVRAYDPVAAPKAAALLGHSSAVTWCASADAALAQADALAICTEWPEFGEMDASKVAQQLTDQVVFDGRNMVDALHWSRHGLRVIQIGRPDGALQPAVELVGGAG